MRAKTALAGIFVASFILHPFYCDDLLEEADDTDDIRLLKTEEREQEADPRYTFVLNSFTEFFKNLGFVSNDNFAYYITFPNKGYTNNIFVNDSTNAFPLIYTAVGAGLVAYVSAYLISQIPLPEFGLGRNDYEDLGFGLQRDLSSYSEDYYPDDEEVFDYEYPDSFFGSASNNKEKKVKIGKTKRKISKRIGPDELRFQEKQFREPGFFERITTAVKSFLTPIYRRSFDTFGGGFEKRIKRYENYWKQRRMLPSRRSWKQGRSEIGGEGHHDQEAGMIGPKMSRQEGGKPSPVAGSGLGSLGTRFYPDRVAEAYDSLSSG